MSSKIALAVAALLVAGTTLQAQAPTKEAKATSLAELKTSLQKLSAQIDLTVTALQSLRASSKNSGDMKNDLDAFNESYGSLEKQLEAARTQGIAMKAKAKEHQEAWEKEVEGIQNPKFREKAADRLADERKMFDKVIERGEELREVGKPFLSDLKDIKTFLDIDPSSKAVSSLSNSIWKLGIQSKTVLKRIDALVAQIDKTLGIPTK